MTRAPAPAGYVGKLTPQEIRNWALEDAAKVADRYGYPEVSEDIRALIRTAQKDPSK